MSNAIWLPVAAVDVLYELIGCCGPGDRPYPFEIPHLGRTNDERAGIRSAVVDDLTRRRLVRDGEPEPDVADALRLLGRPDVAIASVALLDPGRPPLRARAAVGGGRCVVGVLDDRGLDLDQVRPSAMAIAITALLPDCAPGQGHSVTVPAPPPTGRAAEPDGYLTTAGSRGRAVPRNPAVDAVLRRPRSRIGQFSVITGGRTTRLSWFDTDVGRYLTYARTGHDGAAWTVHAPADNARLAATLTDLIATT